MDLNGNPDDNGNPNNTLGLALGQEDNVGVRTDMVTRSNSSTVDLTLRYQRQGWPPWPAQGRSLLPHGPKIEMASTSLAPTKAASSFPHQITIDLLYL